MTVWEMHENFEMKIQFCTITFQLNIRHLFYSREIKVILKLCIYFFRILYKNTDFMLPLIYIYTNFSINEITFGQLFAFLKSITKLLFLAPIFSLSLKLTFIRNTVQYLKIFDILFFDKNLIISFMFIVSTSQKLSLMALSQVTVHHAATPNQKQEVSDEPDIRSSCPT